jgi:hypothetical protein
MRDRGLMRRPANEYRDPVEAILIQKGPQQRRSTLDQHGPHPEAPQLDKGLFEIVSLRANHLVST